MPGTLMFQVGRRKGGPRYAAAGALDWSGRLASRRGAITIGRWTGVIIIIIIIRIIIITIITIITIIMVIIIIIIVIIITVQSR